MKRIKILLSTAVLVVFALSMVSSSLLAEEKEKKEKNEFSGSFMLGYRMVDTSGVETKYKEDINLEKGPRLFNLRLQYNPNGNLNKVLDKLEFYAYNLGGDPFESYGVEAVKYGKYKFQYDHKKSAYFYQDNLKAGDYHTFDFDRISDSGLLKLWLGKDAHVYMNYNRYTKKGRSVTVLDVNRVEFEMEKPVEEKSQDVSFGADYSCKLFSIAFDERILDYSNANSFFLPGYADGGENAFYPSALYYYYMNQPYDIKGNIHSLKISLRPLTRLLIKGSMQINDQDINYMYNESAWGIDYLGDEFSYTTIAEKEFSFTRKTYIYDADITYLFSNKFALFGAARYSKFDQKGTVTFEGEETAMDLKYENGGFEAGVQFQPSSKLGFTVGYKYEQRDIKSDPEEAYEEENLTTTRKSVFGNVKWNMTKCLALNLDYQNGTYDRPFTLISPTSFNRAKALLKFNKNKFYANLSYQLTKSKTDWEALEEEYKVWDSTTNKLGVRMGIHDPKWMFFLGYTYIKVDNEGDRMIAYPPDWSGAASTFEWDSLYLGKSGLFDAYLNVKVHKDVGLGGYVNYYRNKGSWELSRLMMKAFLKYEMQCGLIGELGYRYINFKEKLDKLNDYKANIFEISFGYGW